MKLERQFTEIYQLINKAKTRAFKAVNTELINLYWEVGKYISNKVSKQEWGKGIVENLSKYLNKTEPDLKGFSSQNLWRMKQFYEAYYTNSKLSPLVGVFLPTKLLFQKQHYQFAFQVLFLIVYLLMIIEYKTLFLLRF